MKEQSYHVIVDMYMMLKSISDFIIKMWYKFAYDIVILSLQKGVAMNTISEKEYLLSLPDMTEDDYNQWKKLMRAMTTSARMMGLKDCSMTQQVFRTALDNLMDF